MGNDIKGTDDISVALEKERRRCKNRDLDLDTNKAESVRGGWGEN